MPATDPLRLRILKNLTSVLQEIDGTQDWHYDVSAACFRGRVIFGENDPIPMLAILEVPIPAEQQISPPDSGLSAGRWELIIQGFCADDRDNPTDPGHILLADVKKRLAQEKMKNKQRLSDPSNMGILGMKNHITDLIIGAGTVRPPDELSAKAYFWLAITLQIVENLYDPYED